METNFTPEKLQAIYLDYFNDYLTLDKFAEDNYISRELAALLIKEGKYWHEFIVNNQRERKVL